MRCRDCGKGYIPKIGNLKLQDKVLGEYLVPNVEYEACDGCGKVLYLPKTLKTIELFEAERKQELLYKISIGEFISATETAQILDCTKQALSKHKRISRGFIHFMKFKNQLLFLKKSVHLFEKTGDGRCPLTPQKTKNEVMTVAMHYHSWKKIDITSDASFTKTFPERALEKRDYLGGYSNIIIPTNDFLLH